MSVRTLIMRADFVDCRKIDVVRPVYISIFREKYISFVFVQKFLHVHIRSKLTAASLSYSKIARKRRR